MLHWCLWNANPKLRTTGDCSTRAIAGCLGVTYDKALDLQIEEVKKSYHGFTSREIMEAVLKRFGYVKMKQPRKANRKKYEVRELDKVLTKEQLADGVVVNVPRHYVLVKSDRYIDTWDSGNCCVGNYFAKVRK